MEWHDGIRYLLLTGATVLIAGVIGWIQTTWPSRRRRWIFVPRPCWLVRWLCGDIGPGGTLWQGGVLMPGVFWWGLTSGLIPASPFLHGGLAAWGLLLAVALVNAGRKADLRARARWLLSVLTAAVLVQACLQGEKMLILLTALPA
ncbi:TPA: hypothetical protein ACOEP6_004812 [Enterobacter ludwigii]